ncbi:MAG: hypothetical protein WEB06_12495 [Actinomycetota bacterium]
MRPKLLAFTALVAVTSALLLVPAGTGIARTPEQEIWPAFYEGDVRYVMMGPSGNSDNSNQLWFECFGLGPDRSAKTPTGPALYSLFIPGATQMGCTDQPDTFMDMVLTAVPGDPDYKAHVTGIDCVAGSNFPAAGKRYTSEAAVDAGISAGELECFAPYSQLSPVVPE